MEVKNIEKVTDKKYIITMDLCTDPPFNEVKFEAIHLREDEKYIYAMCKIPNETMLRMVVKNDKMEIYNVQLGKWETEKEFYDQTNEYLKGYAEELLKEFGSE